MTIIASFYPKALLRRSRYLMPILVGVISPMAQADQGPASVQVEDDQVVELSAFTVSANPVDRYRANDAISAVRVRAPLIDTASSISVLTRDFIDDISPGRLWDATRFVAGVQEGRLYTFSDRMIMRGFENNGRTVDNFFYNTNQNYDEVLVDRLEVSKGPNAILSPAGTPGGSVNVVTKSPLFTARNTLTALVGAYDAGKVTLDVTGPVRDMPNLAYRLIAAGQDTRREWSENARLRRKTISPMFTYRITPSTQVTAKMSYSDSWAANAPLYVVDSNISGVNAAPRLDPVLKKESSNGYPDWHGLHYVDTTANIQLTSALTEHLNLRVAGHARREREDSKQTNLVLPSTTTRYEPTTGILTPNYTWSLNSTTGQYVPTFSQFFDFNRVVIDRQATDYNDTYAAGQVDLAVSYKFAFLSTQTVVGAGTDNEHSYNRINRATPTSPSSAGTTPNTVFNMGGGEYISLPEFAYQFQDNRVGRRTRQFYINERLGLFNERLFLTGGLLKYSVYSVTRDAFNNRAPAVLEASKNVGLASIVVKPIKNVSVYASTSTNATPSVVNNQTVWAEGKQFEYGAKSELFNQRLSMTIAHFQITQTNISIPNPNRLFDPSASPNVLNDYKDHGWEFEVTGAATKEISVMASLTHLKLRDSLGRRVRAIADDTASILVNYHPTGVLKGFSTSLSASYSGSKPGDVPSTNFTPLNVVTQRSFLVKAYTMWNGNLSYRMKRATFTLFVDNIFDKDDITQAGARAGSGLAPAFRRNIKFSTTFEF